MSLLLLGIKSLWSRRFTVLLIVMTIAISTALLLGVERVKQSARSSFTSTVSGV
ncbi:MAG: putative ABC transport system permease protein, partial [Gammaproteobacteria bacterium]